MCHPDDYLAEADMMLHAIMMLTADEADTSYVHYQNVLHSLTMRCISLIKDAREELDDR
jgi:hypothetical protein